MGNKLLISKPSAIYELKKLLERVLRLKNLQKKVNDIYKQFRNNIVIFFLSGGGAFPIAACVFSYAAMNSLRLWVL